MSEDDPIARLRAASDQAREATKEMAQNLGAFNRELLTEGFSAEHAFALTADLMALLITNFGGGDDE